MALTRLDSRQATFTPAGTGAVVTTVQDKLRESVSVKDFGAVGDGVTDDTAAVQAAIDYCGSIQVPCTLPKGNYKITSPLVLGRNCVLEGGLFGFNSRISPRDCAAFLIDGSLVTGGFAFNCALRNILVDCSGVTTAQDYLILLNNCYRVLVEQVRFSSANNSSLIASGIKTTGIQNMNTLRRVFVIGDGSAAPTGSGILYAHSSGVVYSENCDVEEWQKGQVITNGASVDIYSPYSERVANGITITAPSTSPTETQVVNIHGGALKLASATSVGLNLIGSFSDNEVLNISGLRFESDDHVTKTKGINLDGSFSWANTNRITLDGIDWSWIAKPAALAAVSHITPYNPYTLGTGALESTTYSIKKASVADNTATDVFSISPRLPADLTPFQPIYVRVKAFAEHNGFGGALEESLFVVRERAGTSTYVTTKQIIAQVREDGGAVNYAFTTFALTATAGASSVVFSLTSDFATTIIDTIDAYFVIEVIGAADFAAI